MGKEDISQIFDVCLVGSGLAGISLAWSLHWVGLRVAIIDHEQGTSASRIAAGLITPITGQRLVKHPQFDLFWTTAKKFYQRVEQESSESIFHPCRMVRIFRNPQEREVFEQRHPDEYGESVISTEPDIDLDKIDAPFGGFEMSGGRLDVAAFRRALMKSRIDNQPCFNVQLKTPEDVQFVDGTVRIPTLNLTTQRLIFCQGFQSQSNPWFGSVPFDATKGEILTVDIPDLNEERVIHRGIWLVHEQEDLYRVGATHDHEHLDDCPTNNGCDELCRELKQLLVIPFDVVDHHAAVRPIILGRLPILGMHPQHPQLGIFNGLASKGSLLAPWHAELFARAIVGKAIIPKELDVARFLESSSCES